MTNLIGHEVERRPELLAEPEPGSISTASARRAPAARWGTSPASGDDVGDPVAFEVGDAVLERQLLLLQPL